jgi:hypothetical protein
VANIESVLPEGYRPNSIYSHVVIADGQRLVFIAGQVPTNTAGELVGEGDMGAQAEQVYENLAKCLAAAGATFRDVVRLDTYVVNQTGRRYYRSRQSGEPEDPGRGPGNGGALAEPLLASDVQYSYAEAIQRADS